MQCPSSMSFGLTSDPFYVEYIRRSEAYNMPVDHYHSYYEIYYLLSGERIYFIKDTSYRVQAGDLVFIEKHEVHKTRNAEMPAHERMIIHFDDRFLHAVPKQQGKLLLTAFAQESPVLRLPDDEMSIIDSHMKRVLLELEQKKIGSEMVYPAIITDLLLIAARYLQKNKPMEAVYSSPMHQKISEIVRYLNINFAEKIQLNRISEQFYVSPYYLSRMFKEITGFTLIDYLNLTRIREAQRLLRETNLKITEIAGIVGFDNFSHFGKTFKKITRISARDYRYQIDTKGSGSLIDL